MCVISFLAGATHEQAIVMIPMIVIIYIFLKIKKIAIPQWYWLSLPFFLLGFSIIMISPGNNIRLLEYGNALNWEFMGEQINWLELGWKKYFYALYRHIFITLSNWYSGPDYLPSTWHLQLLIVLFTILNIRKYKSYLDNHILLPLFYWMLSWGTCIVMAASPTYHSIPLEFSKLFLYIALTGSIYYYLKDPF